MEKIYVLNFEFNKGEKDDLKVFQNKLDKLIGKKEFHSLMDISGDGRVRILSRHNEKDDTSDFLMITEDEEDAVFIWASGYDD